MMKLRKPHHHGRSRAPSGSDPASEDCGDTFWLGGEAMVAPACIAALRDANRLVADECADPGWLGI